MKHGITLETDRLLIRNWTLTDTDRQIWHELNSDEQVMKHFPFRRNRKQADAVLEQFTNTQKDIGYGWAVACLKDTGEPIGFTGLARVNFKVPFTGATEIGWRYVTRHWGKGYATEAAIALVNHGFDDLGLDKIVSFAVPQNTASIAIMQRLGMRAIPALDFDHPGIGEDYAHLRRHVYYELTKDEWVK